MSFLNLMGNKLKVREVNDALLNENKNSGGGSTGGVTLKHDTIVFNGDGTTSYSVTFPHKPLFFSIYGKALSNEFCGVNLVPYGISWLTFITQNRAVLGGSVEYSQDELTMTVSTTGDAGYIANKDGSPITVDYFYN